MSRTHGESIGDLLGRLARDLTDLFAGEFRIFASEAKEAAAAAATTAFWCGAAAVAALGAFGAFTAAAIALLAQAMQLWLAALLVAAVYGVAAVVLLCVAKVWFDRVRAMRFERTVESVKEDAQWIATAVQ